MRDKNNIKILVADDHNLVREGIVSLLKNYDEFEVVGQSADGAAAVKLAKDLQPDVVIMDLSMPVLNGLEATYQINRDVPESKVLILSQHENEEYVIEVLKAGASGYILKSSVSEELVNAINRIIKGEKFFSSSISKMIMDDYIAKAQGMEKKRSTVDLTHREREVLQLIVEGSSNQDIANKLFISIRTVEFHRANIMHKLNIHDLAGLVKYAIQKKIIEIDI